jgi:hypothetical protein
MLVFVNFSNRPFVCDDGMILLLAANPNLVNLHCRECKQVGAATLVALSEHCPKIEVLDMSGCKSDISDECLISVALGCPRLIHVGLSDMDDVGTDRITAKSLDKFVLVCKGLQNIQRSEPHQSYCKKRGGFCDWEFGESEVVCELDLT